MKVTPQVIVPFLKHVFELQNSPFSTSHYKSVPRLIIPCTTESFTHTKHLNLKNEFERPGFL